MNLFVSGANSVFRAGGEVWYVLRRHPAGILPISPELALLLEQADRPRTLEEHADRILAKGLTAEDRASIEAKYQQLADEGLLVPVDTSVLAATIDRSAADHERQRLDTSPETELWLAWPTRNRPDLVERSIRSWFEHAGARAEPKSLLVCDDSDFANAERTRSVCESVRESAARVVYFGREGREDLARFLIRRGVSEVSTRFALFDDEKVGDPQSLNRNATILLTVGSRFVSSDDDVVYKTAKHPQFSSDVKFASSSYQIDFKFFANRSQLLETVALSDDSFIDFLPDTVGGVLPQRLHSAIAADKAHLRETRPVDLNRLRNGLRIGVTSVGGFGHSGMPSSQVILGLRHRLGDVYENNAAYLLAVGSSEVLRVAKLLTVGFTPTFMSMTYACDNSEVLPPFFPVKRSMDGVWGILCALIDPSMAFAQLPVAVYHDPDYHRPHLRASAAKYETRFAEYLRILLLAWDPPPFIQCPSKRLGRLGAYLQDLSNLTWNQFQCRFRQSWIGVMGSQIAQLESLVEHFHGAPSEWAKDVEAYVSSALEWAQLPDLPMPADIGGESDIVLRLLSRFGGLLLEWPKMRAIAQDFDVSPYEI